MDWPGWIFGGGGLAPRSIAWLTFDRMARLVCQTRQGFVEILADPGFSWVRWCKDREKTVLDVRSFDPKMAKPPAPEKSEAWRPPDPVCRIDLVWSRIQFFAHFRICIA